MKKHFFLHFKLLPVFVVLSDFTKSVKDGKISSPRIKKIFFWFQNDISFSNSINSQTWFLNYAHETCLVIDSVRII